MFLVILLLFPLLLFGAQHETPLANEWTTPWFTGPLLAPSAATNPKGVTTWQPYIFVTNSFGEYDSHWSRRNTPDTWTVEPFVDITYGLGSFIDIEADVSFVYTTTQGASAIRLNDWNLFLGFQALRDEPGTWKPDLRITLQEVFPFGQYDHLNPKKHGTDGTGQGSYQTGINFNFEKAFKLAPQQYFRLRWTAGYLFPVPVHIQGISVYGGVPGTSGKVYPGQTLTVYLSGELDITHQWVFAFDTEYVLTRHDRFTGKHGVTEDGEKADVGNPVSQQISFAPAIEYNLSENFGLIGGVWFSLAGKNASQFFGGIFSVVITY